MVPFRFLSLPAELQTAIIDCILRPEHLAQVCLVSKQLHRIALPMLYKDFSINVSEWSEEELERFLVRGHAGHPHIRSLEVDSEDLNGEEKALKVAKDALQVLPKNSLRSIRCPLERGIDNDLVILLAAQQRNLDSTSIGPLRPNALNLIDALKPWPPTVESIVVPWTILSTADFTFYRDLIERSRKRLLAMTIRVHDFAWLHKYDKTTGACEQLARGFFDHTEGAPYDRPQLELRDLNFQNQDLRAFDSTWQQYIDFTKLRTLQIWNCPETDSMLKRLIDLAPSQPFRLEGLVLSFEEVSESPTLAEKFLSSLTGLRYLNICYIPSTQTSSFNMGCLASHADTVQDLYLGIGSSDSFRMAPLWQPSSGEVQWLTSQCRNLRQLALAMPELDMDDALAGRWGKYQQHLTLLASLPQLKILRILSWPTDCNPKQYSSHWYTPRWKEHRREYLSQLDTVADSIARLFASLRSSHSSRLSVITFGNAEMRDHAPTRNHGLMRMFKPVTYKIRSVESEFGFLLETARLDPAEMQYEEPIAYVFDEDTDQGLSLESYPWANAGGPR